MKRRTQVLLAAAILIPLAVVFILPAFLPPILITDTGSPELAIQWKSILQSFPNPDEAQRQDGRVAVRRFDNGDWLIGLSKNSHGSSPKDGGGTIVVKDSRGNVRAFFTHVCGPEALQAGMNRAKSIDDFYQRFTPEVEFALP